jgi:hypothetical protein
MRVKVPVVPASFFGMVIGLAGLGTAWRWAHQVWGLPAVANRRLPLMGLLAAMLVVSACAPPQMMGALVEPENQIQAPLQPAKPMTPERTAWLKDRCAQLVAYFDRYGGTGRNEDSDGVRNHTRIGAAVDCERGQYDKGISAMEALLERKHYDVPPATTGLAQTPVPPLRPHGEARHTVYQQIFSWLDGQYSQGRMTIPLFAFDAFDQPTNPDPVQTQYGIFSQNSSFAPTGLKAGITLPPWTATPIDTIFGTPSNDVFVGQAPCPYRILHPRWREERDQVG